MMKTGMFRALRERTEDELSRRSNIDLRRDLDHAQRRMRYWGQPAYDGRRHYYSTKKARRLRDIMDGLEDEIALRDRIRAGKRTLFGSEWAKYSRRKSRKQESFERMIEKQRKIKERKRALREKRIESGVKPMSPRERGKLGAAKRWKGHVRKSKVCEPVHVIANGKSVKLYPNMKRPQDRWTKLVSSADRKRGLTPDECGRLGGIRSKLARAKVTK